MIPIYEPYITDTDKDNVRKCLETNWIPSQGDFILEFEDRIAQYHSSSHAVVTSNCTTALHLAMKGVGIGPGDEVICPDLTFIAPANMVKLAGADLVLADIDPVTLNLDPAKLSLKVTSKTKAIVVVHQFGHAAPMDEIMEIARQHNLKVIEDNAESIGGHYKGKMLGTFGDVTCFSFFANKIITTGEGGAIITNDEIVAHRCRELRDHGMSKSQRYLHVDLGYNYRMTNMQAAIGCGQISRLDEILEKRFTQLIAYESLLRNVEGLSMRSFEEWCQPVHWMTTVTLDRQFSRDECMVFLKDKGIDCRQMIFPVHHAQHFRSEYNDADFPNAIDISYRSLHLPSSLNLANDQIEFIVDSLNSFMKEKSV